MHVCILYHTRIVHTGTIRFSVPYIIGGVYSTERANFFFGPTSDLENFSRLANLPFLFVLREVTLLRGLVNLWDKTLESTQLGS